MKWQRILTIFVFGQFVAACATFEAENPYEGDEFAELTNQEPLPYHVRIHRIGPRDESEDEGHEGGGGPTEEVEAKYPRIATGVSRNELHDALRESLVKHGVFSRVSVVGEAGPEPDLELFVRVEVPEQRPPSGSATNMAWLNGGLWLFAGVPGWFLRDVEFNQDVTIHYEIDRPSPHVEGQLKNRTQSITGAVPLDDDTRLNFIRRAGLADYLLQIVVPPPFLSNAERVDDSLFENYVSRVQRNIPRSLKAELLQRHALRNLPLALRLPSPSGRARFLVLSQDRVEEIKASVDEKVVYAEQPRAPSRDVREAAYDEVDEVYGATFRGVFREALRAYSRAYLIETNMPSSSSLLRVSAELASQTADPVIKTWTISYESRDPS